MALYTFNINADLYNAFCAKHAGADIDTVIASLMAADLVSKELNTPHAPRMSYGRNLRREEFKHYLDNIARKSTGDHYSSNVSKGYSSAINTISSDYNIDLWNMTDPDEVWNHLNQLLRDASFQELDARQNKRHSNAMKRYAEFLQFKRVNRV